MTDLIALPSDSNASKRRKLPNKRPAETISFERDGLRYCMTIGVCADGAIGEIFLNATPHNSFLDIFAADAAIIVSLALQHGCELATIRHALRRDARGNAASPIGAALDQVIGPEGAS